MPRYYRVTVLLSVAMACAGCKKSANRQVSWEDPGGGRPSSTATTGPAPLAASSSYLAVAVRDLLGEAVELMLLAEPGMCPGHFDLRPSQVRQLRNCQALVRFDFQSSLDSRLAGEGTDGPAVVALKISGGMCEPRSYLSACRQLAESLVELQRLSRVDADQRLAAISERMDRLDTWSGQQIDAASLGGTPVLCSGHQAAFCRHLGLDVVATFSAADTAQPSQIDQAIKAGERAGVRLVIANLPEGRRLADALADRLAAQVVVFGNFPVGLDRQAFDELVFRNVTSLVEAAKP